MKGIIESQLADRMIKLIASEITQMIKEKYQFPYEVKLGEIKELIDKVAYEKYDWDCPLEENKQIFFEIVRLINE